jgi:hypothetical protein
MQGKGSKWGHAQNKVPRIAKSGPTFWECPSPRGFALCKAQGKGYMNPISRL